MAKSVQSELVSLDLFSGVGGISLGMEMAGIRSGVAVDLDPHAIDTFNRNFGASGAVGLTGDLEDASTFSRIMEVARARGVNVVCGGPPCQGFSQVGNHRDLENDPRNRLYRCFVRAVQELKPRAFVMENVPGLAQRSGGKVLEQIVESLRLNGTYRVAAGVLQAADFGVPQSRERLIFLGIHVQQGVEPELPHPPLRLFGSVSLERVRLESGFKYELRSSALQGELFSGGTDALRILRDDWNPALVTVKQALSDLEHLSPNDTLRQQQGDSWGTYASAPQSAYQALMRSGTRDSFFNAQVPFMWEDTRRRLASIPHGGNYRDLPEDLQRRYLNGQKWGPETGRDDLSRKHFSAYRRLHPDFPSWTLNTKADCVYHYDGSRALSVREFARLSSFPDHFEFLGPDKHTRYRLVGNAVPPLLAAAVGRQLVSLLETKVVSRPKRTKVAALARAS